MMMMMSSAVNKQSNLHQLSAMGNAKKPTEAHKQEAGANTSPKLDLVDAKEDSFEFASSPREAVADPPAVSSGDNFTPTATVVAPPAPAKSMAGLVGLGLAFIGLGAGSYAAWKAHDIGGELEKQAKKLDVAETAKKLADEAKAFAEKGLGELTGRLKTAEDHAKDLSIQLNLQHNLHMDTILEKNPINLSDADLSLLFRHVQEVNDVKALTHLVAGFKNNYPKQELAKGLPTSLLGHVSNLVKHTDVTGNPDRQVVSQGKLIQALLAVQEKLPEIPPVVADATQQTANMTKYKSDFEAVVMAQAKTLGASLEAQLKRLKDKTTKADIAEELLGVFSSELDTLKNLATRDSILPNATDITYFVNTPREIARFKGRVFDGVKAGEVLNQEVANAILTERGLNSDPELLAHLAETLVDEKHPLHTEVRGIVDSLQSAAKNYAEGIASAAGAIPKKSEVLAGKVQAVLEDLRTTSPDGNLTVDILASQLKLDKAADKVHLDLLMNYNTAKLAPAEHLTYIKNQLNAIAAAVKADNPPPPTPTPKTP